MRQFCSKKLSIELEQKKTLFGKFQKKNIGYIVIQFKIHSKSIDFLYSKRRDTKTIYLD